MDKEPLTQLGLVKEQSSGSSMQTTLKKNLTWALSCHLLSYGNRICKTKVCIIWFHWQVNWAVNILGVLLLLPVASLDFYGNGVSPLTSGQTTQTHSRYSIYTVPNTFTEQLQIQPISCSLSLWGNEALSYKKMTHQLSMEVVSTLLTAPSESPWGAC